jgi:hypothetical protein
MAPHTHSQLGKYVAVGWHPLGPLAPNNKGGIVTANGVLYTLLEQELKPAVDSAVEKSGNLFGDNLQDSRINNATRGDGLAVIETRIFSLERFGDSDSLHVGRATYDDFDIVLFPAC